MQQVISVDRKTCTHCGLCLKDCVLGIIEFDEDQIPRYMQGKDVQCVRCQHCMAICPVGALSFGGKNPAESQKVNYGNSDDILSLIKSRRSVRFYKNQSVPTDKLDALVSMLPYVPTGGNADNLFFALVETKEKMDEIRNITYAEIMKVENPSRFHTIAKNAYTAGNDIIYRGAPSMVAVAIDKKKTIEGCETADPIIALSYFELYAQSLGLGTLWCDMALTIARQTPKVYELLEIPSQYTLDYILLFGLPSIRYARTIQPEMFSVKRLR